MPAALWIARPRPIKMTVAGRVPGRAADQARAPSSRTRRGRAGPDCGGLGLAFARLLPDTEASEMTEARHG